MMKATNFKLKSKSCKKIRNNGGYSLLEVMIGMGIFAVLALASTNLFFSTTVGSTKDSTIRAVKQNGEFALSQIEASLRGAKGLATNQEGQECVSDMRSVSVLNLDDSVTEWEVNQDRIRVDGEYVTADDVGVVGNRMYVNCSYDSGSNGYYVHVRFSLARTSQDKQEEAYNETFETGVSLRNK